MDDLKSKTIKILLVNDSLNISRVICDLIETDEQIKIIAKAVDGADGLKKFLLYEPDLILLDLEMPNMDGMTFLEHLSKNKKLPPVIIVSSYGQNDPNIKEKLYELGASDFFDLGKFSTMSKTEFANILLSKIKSASKSNKNKYDLFDNKSSSYYFNPNKIKGSAKVVVIIGASTGGPHVVKEILKGLNSKLKAGILLVQHMDARGLSSFVHTLDNMCDLSVKFGEDGIHINEGDVLIAPGDNHMIVENDGTIFLDSSSKRFGVRPAVNMTMISASKVFKKKIIGVILSGLGSDGGFGMKVIKNSGGKTIVQSKETCEATGMPQSVLSLHAADYILPTEKISEQIQKEVTILV